MTAGVVQNLLGAVPQGNVRWGSNTGSRYDVCCAHVSTFRKIAFPCAASMLNLVNKHTSTADWFSAKYLSDSLFVFLFFVVFK